MYSVRSACPESRTIVDTRERNTKPPRNTIHDDSYQSSLMIRRVSRERKWRGVARNTSILDGEVVSTCITTRVDASIRSFLMRLRERWQKTSACLKLLNTLDTRLNSRWLKPRDIKARRYPSSRGSAHLLLSYMAVLRVHYPNTKVPSPEISISWSEHEEQEEGNHFTK